MVVRRSGGRPLTASWELAVVLLCALCGAGRAAPWNQDEDLAALGSLDSLLAYEDLRQAVQQAEDAWGQPGAVAGVAPGAVPGAAARGKGAAAWQPAEPDPQLYLLTEYDRGGQGQTRVKRNREAVAAAAAAGRLSARSNNGLRRHVRNPSSSSSQRLSIVNPLDVLRQRLLLEIARRRKASVPQSNSDLGDQGDQRQQQQQQQQQLPSETRPQEQGETNHIRDEQDDWSARQQANGWVVLVLLFLPQDPGPILYDRILRLAFVSPDGINPLALFLYFCGGACGNGDVTH
ncbi:Corticotropin releasing-factor (CRF)-related diuretic hormone [Frankliniella occidentalis]|nr:Corticotropin releasing-factor (CRF)-related diuretic hormone [Frankliniella occidentalis]